MFALKNLLGRIPDYRGCLHWLRPEVEADLQRLERRLAYARAFVVVSCLVIGWYGRNPGLPGGAAPPFLHVFGAYSLLLIFSMRRRATGPAFRSFVHVADIILVATFYILTGGPNDQSSVLLFFLLMGAAVRWAHWGVLATAAGTLSLVLLANTLIRNPGFNPGFLVNSGYVLVVGLLLGLISETVKKLGAEKALIERMFGLIDMDADFSRTTQQICTEVVRVFGARKVLLAVREGDTGIAYLRQMEHGASESSLSELTRSVQDNYFLFVPISFSTDRSGSGGNLAAQFAALHPFKSILDATSKSGRQWVLRIFVLDPAPAMSRQTGVNLLQTVVQRISAPLYDRYLLWQLNTRIGETERARIACELHDGPIQSLLAIEMRLDVLRRRLSKSDRATQGGELAQLQEQLRQEIIGLREFTQQLKPVPVDSEHFTSFLGDVAARFQRTTGIMTRFVSHVDKIDLPEDVRRELIRIVQEALVNVRKHSDANSVELSVRSRDGRFLLAVADNGRGLGFKGRLSQEQLDARGKGPAVIKERVRLIGGELSIESTPNQGTRLEVAISQSGYGKSQSKHPDTSVRQADDLPGGAAKSASTGA